MAERHLHIITHDIPFPADFGGVIDIFYKIKSLHQNGVKIHLHCFENKRTRQIELEKYCEAVYYYERKTGLLVCHKTSRIGQDCLVNARCACPIHQADRGRPCVGVIRHR